MASSEIQNARRIQRWWRQTLHDRATLAERVLEIANWRGLSTIIDSNEALIRKLAKIRMEKEEEIGKYEFILSLPAREVNNFLLFLEDNRPGTYKDEQIMPKIRRERFEKAARILQRFFRRVQHKRMEEKYQKSIRELRAHRRAQLLDTIDDRLSRQKKGYQWPLEDIKKALSNHKRNISTDQKLFARRQLLIQSVQRDICHIEGVNVHDMEEPKLRALSDVSPFQFYKAKEEHNQKIEEIEDFLLSTID